MWHVSIACHGKKGPVKVSALDRQTVRFMVELAKSLLQGVGSDTDFVGAGDVALHVRRALHYHEIEGLPSAWLAIPAVDMAGELKPVVL